MITWQKEHSFGHMLGPFEPDVLVTLPEFQVNHVGVIPKGHDNGKWRYITDLYYPPNSTVSDAIEPDQCFHSYVLVDQVADVAVQLGSGALLAKIDIESAYWLIPVQGDGN